MSKRSLVLMCSIFLIVPLLFMGCGGSDGSDGAKGDTGATGLTGPTGPTGPVSNTNESCMVCHTTGKIADISDSNTASITHYNAAHHLPDMTVSVVTVDNVAGFAQVAFHVQKTSDNTAVSTLDNTSFRFYISNLVPAGAVAGTTPQFERWAYEYAAGSVFGTLDISGAASGDYVYTFATGFGDNNAIAEAPDYSDADVQRLIIRVSGGTAYNNAVGILDFNVPATSTTGLGYSVRQFVTADACKKCHGPLFAGAAHAGGYLDTRACVMCHSPIGHYGEEMVTDEAWLAPLVHKIHSAIPMDAFPTRIGGRGYGAVTYPQDVRNCVTCHTDSGLTLGAGDQIDNWKAHPSAAVCGSCHTGADFTTGVGHLGGAQPDTACAFCHPATGHVAPSLGASVTEAHDTSATAVLHPNPKNVPEFDVAIAMSPAKSFYAAGDNVTITVTLKKTSDNTAVPGTLYTTAKDSKGISGGGLSSANLYVYGPRALPKPIFAPTDNTQGHSLFTGTVDKSGTIATDNTGFKYRFTVPSGSANGTYMIRFEGGDYGGVTATDYVTSSSALINFQVGTATVEKKVAGDACIDCHGASRMHLEGAHAHNAPFDTDSCIACHDYSGGYAATISNRVHAVHSANEGYGDMYNKLGGTLTRHWEDVTYPQTTWSSSTGLITTQGVGRCATCHSSGNTSYRSVVGEVSCLGCHGDNPAPGGGGATNHMLQNGGDYPKP